MVWLKLAMIPFFLLCMLAILAFLPSIDPLPLRMSFMCPNYTISSLPLDNYVVITNARLYLARLLSVSRITIRDVLLQASSLGSIYTILVHAIPDNVPANVALIESIDLQHHRLGHYEASVLDT